MASHQRHEELLRAVEQHHEQYIKALRLLHEALATGTSARARQRANSNMSSSPAGLTDMDRDGGENVAGSPILRATRAPPSPAPPSPNPRPIHTLSIDSNTSALQSHGTAVAAGVSRGRSLTSDLRGNQHHHQLAAGGGLGIVPRGGVPVSLYGNESDTEEDVDFIPLLPLVQQQQQQPQQQPQQQQVQQQQQQPHHQQPTAGASSPPCASPRSNQGGEAPRVASAQDPLPPHSFAADDLVRHVRQMDEARASTLVAMLDEVWRRRHELDAARLLGTREDELYGSATYEVYDVGRDAVAVPRHDDRGSGNDGALDLRTVWNTLKEVNPSLIIANGLEKGDWAEHEEPLNSEDLAVGRMTILQEPSPIMLSAVHLTMARNFDMDELLQHLVTLQGNKGKTRAYMQRAFEPSEVRQRSFFFVFKYYTVVGEGLSPAPYQQFDRRPQDHKSPDHIDITECSSVLALSLAGPPVGQVHLRSRRRRVVQAGSVYGHFAPWHLLSFQSFPDDAHSMRSDDARKPFYSGPYAFLDSLAAEYRDAVKRYSQLNELITKLITPSSQFMFEVKLRDKLLFEDKYFTYSRRYFWAYNSLALINEGIKSMMSAYADTFSADFWEGRHQTLWPLPAGFLGTAGARNYLDRLALLREELKRAVADLGAVYHKNEALRKEIKSLREQLFSGSSVKESRRAIEQGDNIKILTSVSMVFLPLTFVTSVFGITEFHFPAEDWRFATTMLCVCVPFFVLILVLQTRAGMGMCKRLGAYVQSYFQGVDEQTKYRRELQSLATRSEAAGPPPPPLVSAVTISGVAGASVEEGGAGLAGARRKQRLRFGRRKKAELGGRGGAGSMATTIAAPASPVSGDGGGSWRTVGGLWRWRKRVNLQARMKADGNV